MLKERTFPDGQEAGQISAKRIFCGSSGWSEVRKRANLIPVATGRDGLRLLAHELDRLLERGRRNPEEAGIG